MLPLSYADPHPALPEVSPRSLTIVTVASVALLAILGITSIWPTAAMLWALWTTDALKSIGIFFPVVSFVLILRAWHALDWEMEGTWWGLVILVVTSTVVLLRTQAVLVFVVSAGWAVYLPPHSLVAVAYASGVVLLFGGTRLFRAALFPLALLWFVNPVPHVFNLLVDLPLQHVSAHVARGFAHLLGQPLSADEMRLMFTPEFGMFIAPGCNGIRGSITMGFLALITGHLNRFRWYATAAVVVAAVLLGYLFNFVRLCSLVIYYIVALHLPRLQKYGEFADYLLGAVLFLLATFLLSSAIRHFGAAARLQTVPSRFSARHPSTPSVLLRLAAMLVFVLLGLSRVLPALALTHSAADAIRDPTAMGRFPRQLGPYALTRTWNESLDTGVVHFHWAEYARAGGGAHISLGIDPVTGSHDTLLCHSARGEDPLWRAALVTATAADPATSFSAAFFNDGVTRYLELTTICTGRQCGEYAANGMHFGLVYSRIHPESLFTQRPDHPIPVLLRVETLDTGNAPEITRQQLTAEMQRFLAAVNLSTVTRPYRGS